MALGSDKELSPRLHGLLEDLAAMAAGEIERRIQLSRDGDHLDAIAYGINILADEVTHAYRRLEHQRELAEEASRSKSSFLAYMSHEIRTPLTAIVGFADLLSSDRFSAAEQRDFLDRVRRNCAVLSKLVDDVLDLSKVEAGELTLESIEVPFRPWLSEAIGAFEPVARAKNISLELAIDRAVPEHVQTDPLRLCQVFNNLVANATKFSDRGVVRIHATCTPDGRLSIDVEDRGMGISPERHTSIFQRFNQGDRSVTRRFGGTGLGLTLSRAICRKMGGDLTLVSSEVGKGSWFRAEVQVIVPEAARQVAHAAERLDARPLAGIRIHVVEDSDDSRVLLITLLHRAGATVTASSDGHSALTVAPESSDLVLMDLQMPVMDGLETTRRLQQSDRSLPVVALTAHAMHGERERVLAAGCVDYLTKPVNRRLLIERILLHARKIDRPETFSRPAIAFFAKESE